jgi:hypothetical protein
MVTSALARVMRIDQEVLANESDLVKDLFAAVQELNQSLQEERLKRRALMRRFDDFERRLIKVET